ncbi:hypothetical protein Tco_1212744 [Tanacetum coccineum]
MDSMTSAVYACVMIMFCSLDVHSIVYYSTLLGRGSVTIYGIRDAGLCLLAAVANALPNLTAALRTQITNDIRNGAESSGGSGRLVVVMLHPRIHGWIRKRFNKLKPLELSVDRSDGSSDFRGIHGEVHWLASFVGLLLEMLEAAMTFKIGGMIRDVRFLGQDQALLMVEWDCPARRRYMRLASSTSYCIHVESIYHGLLLRLLGDVLLAGLLNIRTTCSLIHDYVNCPPLVFDDRIRPATFASISYADFDVILGMDWLASHRAPLTAMLGCDRLARELNFGIVLIPGAEPISKAPRHIMDFHQCLKLSQMARPTTVDGQKRVLMELKRRIGFAPILFLPSRFRWVLRFTVDESKKGLGCVLMQHGRSGDNVSVWILHDLERLVVELMCTRTVNLLSSRVDDEGVVWFEDRLCVPTCSEIRREDYDEAHSSPFTIHPGNIEHQRASCGFVTAVEITLCDMEIDPSLRIIFGKVLQMLGELILSSVQHFILNTDASSERQLDLGRYVRACAL